MVIRRLKAELALSEDQSKQLLSIARRRSISATVVV
jgi:hypothetical protein